MEDEGEKEGRRTIDMKELIERLEGEYRANSRFCSGYESSIRTRCYRIH